MNRIGIFGGSFDPWTVAHQAIVDAAFERNLVDSVVVVPTIMEYHRAGKSKWLSDTDKFRVMYEFLMKSPHRDRIMMDFREVAMRKAGEISPDTWRFINTLERCVKMFPDSELYTIIGTDSLRNFKTWHRWEDILAKCKLIAVMGRDEETVDTDIDYIPLEIPSRFHGISSSKMRMKFKDVDSYIRHITKVGE